MRSFTQTSILLAFTCLLLVLAPPFAQGEDGETLYLRNGKQLSGVSRGVQSGLLRWQMSLGETITIPVDDIDHIEYSVPLPDPVTAATSADGNGLPDIPPAPEETPGASDHGASPSTTDDDSPEAEGDAGVSAEEETHEPGGYEEAFGRFGAEVDDAADYWNSWTKRLEIGGRILRGNTDEDFLNTGLKMEKKSERRFAQVEAGGQFSRVRSVPTSNRWFANSTVDFNKLTEDKWVWFAASKNEHDELESLSYRGSLSTGLGYRFYNEPKKRLVTRFGPGVTYEHFYNPSVDRATPDLFGEVEALWPLYDRTSLEHKTSIYPSLESMDVFRFVSTYGLLIGLDEDERWSLKLGLRHEYNSHPNVDREKSDYTATFLLVYTRN